LARVVKILTIDLTQETYQIESTSGYSDLVGGRVINQRLLSTQVDTLQLKCALPVLITLLLQESRPDRFISLTRF
jgi:aldehyde:ferredoxin oxidoreductase